MKDFLRLAKRQGWAVDVTRRGHLRLTHPKATKVVIASGTPGCVRAVHNIRSDMRRALRETAP